MTSINNIYELKNIKVLGYSTDFNQCECCGKDNLKGTVSILDLNYDVILHFGTTCAVNANKYDNLQALAQAKKEINSLKRDIELNIQFVGTMIRKNKIDQTKREDLIKSYLNWRADEKTRWVRFNWEAWK